MKARTVLLAIGISIVLSSLPLSGQTPAPSTIEAIDTKIDTTRRELDAKLLEIANLKEAIDLDRHLALGEYISTAQPKIDNTYYWSGLLTLGGLVMGVGVEYLAFSQYYSANSGKFTSAEGEAMSIAGLVFIGGGAASFGIGQGIAHKMTVDRDKAKATYDADEARLQALYDQRDELARKISKLQEDQAKIVREQERVAERQKDRETWRATDAKLRLELHDTYHLPESVINLPEKQAGLLINHFIFNELAGKTLTSVSYIAPYLDVEYYFLGKRHDIRFVVKKDSSECLEYSINYISLSTLELLQYLGMVERLAETSTGSE